MGRPRKAGTEMLHRDLNSHASVCAHPHHPPVPQTTTSTHPPRVDSHPCPGARSALEQGRKDHLRERGAPLCYVSARE